MKAAKKTVEDNVMEEMEAPKAPAAPSVVFLESINKTITVVSEGVDAKGRKTLFATDGCTYHAE